MISRDTVFAIGYYAGYIGLFIGALGQVGLLSPLLKPHLPSRIAIILIMLPWLIVFTITFTQQSILSPRPFRICLLFAMCWFAAITIGAEILYNLGYLPPSSPQYAANMLRILMHVGWLGLLFVTPLYVAARRFESKSNAADTDSRPELT